MSLESKNESGSGTRNEGRVSWSKVVTVTVLLLAGLAVAFPLYWMIATSLKRGAEIGVFPPYFVPPHPTLNAYFEALSTGPWMGWFLNTVVISTGATLLTLSIATPAAYVIARRDIRGAKPLYVMFIGVLMIPVQILLIPLYVIFARFGMVDSPLGLIIAYSVIFLGFSVFLLHSFFTNLPSNLEDAARIGGISERRLFLRVILPLAKPGIATAAVFIFVFTWNEFLFALTFLQTEANYTVSVGLQQFQGLRGTVAYNQLFAMSTLATFPVVVLFAFFSNRFIEGMGGLGMK